MDEFRSDGRTRSRSRSGIAVLWVVIVMAVLLVVTSMAIDYGRAQLVKQELRRAADAAARAGASSLLVDPDEAVRRAINYAGRNRADASAVTITGSDVEIGTWNPTTRTFSSLAGAARSNGDAIRVVARRTAASGNAVPTLFARIGGKRGFDVAVESIALKIEAVAVDQNVQGTANPFLAGMPTGSVASLNNPHNSPDYAGTVSNPRQSPFAVNMRLAPGMLLNFDGISGTMRHDPNLAFYEPDGQLNSIGRNTNGPENGISDIRGPINALVGVFLTDEAPNRTSAPRWLDFSTPASRDFNELRPELKQVFFIGDGRNSRGERQNFVVPAGATRLYLASWDFFEWNNNAGYRNVRISRPGRIVTVR